MYYKNNLKLFITVLKKDFRILLGIAIFVIIGIAIISYASKPKVNLDDPNYLFKRGSEYFLNEKYDKAIADFTAALKINPTNINCLFGRGGAYIQNKEYDKAIADLTNALILKPSDPRFLSGRGTAYLLKEDYNKAIDDFELTLQIEPNNFNTQKQLELARKKVGK
jgi:tetratricopeptide (TPR) repeat protein